MRVLCLILCLLLINLASLAQTATTKFYDFIKDDSLKMYFNNIERFVEKPCADRVRYTRLTDAGDFNGFFEDREILSDKLVSKGHYVSGKKHGTFEEYYADGKLKSRGEYANNKPSGSWEYFYENGMPERTLKITETDTLIIRFVDKNGNAKVVDGNGEFEGFVQGGQTGHTSIVARGKVVNGKPHGDWTSESSKLIFAKESFENGKFIKGSFPNARSNKNYRHKSFLKTFLFDSYITDLEKFNLQKCNPVVVKNNPKTPNAQGSASESGVKYQFDMNRFSSELRPKVDKLVENDFRTGKSNDYLTNNLVTIQFSVNENGKPQDFKLLSGFGYQFYTTLISTIRAHAVFPPNTKEMYFHLNLNFPGGTTYQYGFVFSQDRRYAGY